MLELLSSGLLSLWLTFTGDPNALAAVSTWQDTPWLVLPSDPDPATTRLLQQYLNSLEAKGLPKTAQGIWLQAGPLRLASNQAERPLPAASLTKIATSLVALHTWGPNHQFETLISATGPIQQGILQGDLVVKAAGDPMLVWEEAFAIGQALNQLGIRKVTGNLILNGPVMMNFEPQPEKAGALLKQAFNASQWDDEAKAQFATLPPGTPRPQIAIAGRVQAVTSDQFLPPQTPLVRHQSLPLVQILKQMNIYSNNEISESLANSAGGAQSVADRAAELAGVPREEVLLVNGSGLGTDNQISPRAACAMFAAVQRYLQSQQLTIADLFPISGVDKGTIDFRTIPTAAVVKTGTLNDVSALAGVVPTRDRGLVWFTIINRGTDLEDLRDQQDVLLQQIVRQWGSVPTPPVAIAPHPHPVTTTVRLGASDRNQLLMQPAVEIQHLH